MPPPPGDRVVALVGATATGKSAVAVDLALGLPGGAEIVNVDSRQVYRGLGIGTAQPSAASRRGVPHHGFDLLDPRESMSAGAFAAWAARCVGEIRSRGRLPILVGGTGFYLRALRDGLSPLPVTIPELRSALRTAFALRPARDLHRWLRLLDPRRAAEVSPSDRDRILRAVEVVLMTGRPMSALMAAPREPALSGEWIVLGLRMERSRLWCRISQRVEAMFDEGLEEEIRAVRAAGIPADAPGLSAIGYAEAAAVVDGALSRSEAVERIAAATRRYAKRQETWFRAEPGIEWFDATAEGLVDELRRCLGDRGALRPGMAG